MAGDAHHDRPNTVSDAEISNHIINSMPAGSNGTINTGSPTSEQDVTKMTCDVLCSLGSAPATTDPTSSSFPLPILTSAESAAAAAMAQPVTKGGKSSSLSACPKQHQLPMFLSKTYHMIDRCEPSIATWSADGSNFVVKNVEKFAGCVLPLYFKHSNFSSFARQLNFYGFRKLRTDPILTSDVDPRTACYVRFYHEKFQKDRPELLHEIKRATKSDQQSKDDVESLKAEVSRLKESIGQIRDDTDRRLAEMSYECNRRITSIAAEYDKLTAVVQQLVASNAAAAAAAAAAGAPPVVAHSQQPAAAAAAPPGQAPAPTLAGLPASVHNTLRHNPDAAAIAAAAAVAAGVQPALPLVPTPSAAASTTPAPTTPAPGIPAASNLHPQAAQPQQAPALPAVAAPTTNGTTATTTPSQGVPDLMQSLSHAAAISLQQQAQQQHQQQTPVAVVTASQNGNEAVSNGATFTTNGNHDNNKRPAQGEAMGAPPSSMAKS